MKLKYFLSATLFAFAFTACTTSSDGPEDPKNVNTGNAELTVGVKSIATKAADENSIEDLMVLVFNGTGDDAKLEVIGKWDDANHVKDEFATGDFTSECMKLTAGKKSILVLANVPEDLKDEFTAGENGTSLASATTVKQSLKAPYTNNGSITMSSAVYEVNLIAGTHNLLGFPAGDYEKYTVLETEPVKLYRTISKISLGTVAIKNDKFPDAKIEIKRVFALRGAKSTYLAVNQKTKWGEIFDKDADNYFYGITDFDNVWTDEKDKAAYITGYEGETATYAAAYNFYDAAASSEEIILGGASSEDFPTEIKFTDEFYAFENTEAANWTLLVIHGDFSYMHIETDEDGNVLSSKLVTLENRYYTVRIGDPNQGADFTKIKKDDNFPGRTVHSGIMRNLHYQIAKITINGTGSTKILYQEDGDASLDVNVVVVDYGEVEQIWEF